MDEVSEQLPVGLRRDTKSCGRAGGVPVIDQSEDGVIGWHDDEPGVHASDSRPVVTFANHTCEMRIHRRPFSVIQNVFPKIGREPVCSTPFLYYATKGRVRLTDYKGHHPIFREAWLAVPPRPQQDRIVNILSAYDDLIENCERRIRVLDEMARALYREWFVNFRYPGHEKVPLVESPLGRIPRGWARGVLGDLVDFRSGFPFRSKTFTADGQHRLVTIKNVQHGRFSPECDARINELPENMPPHCLLDDGHILLSLTGNVGRVCLVYGGPFLLNQRVAKLEPRDETDRPLVYCMFRSPELCERLERLSNGVAQQNLSPIVAAQLDVALPSMGLRERFAALAEPLINGVVALHSASDKLRVTRDLLLPRLLSGQLSVEALP